MRTRDELNKKIFQEKKSSLIIQRDNINKLLDEIVNFKIIYISGPVGCGKTTAVKEWCNSIDEQVLWYSIDDKEIESDKLIEKISEEIEKFHENGKTKIIVVDNFENVRNKDVLQFSIIDEMFDEYKLILISRSVLTSGLKYFLVKRELEIITYVDLLFNDEEIVDYFKVNGFDIDDNNLEKIKKDTGGWVIGLNAILGALKVNNNEFNEQMYTDSVLNAYEFLDYKIFEKLDDNIKDFLIKTSLLDEIDIGIARFIAEDKGLENIFDRFLERESFLIKIRPGVYKYVNYAKKYLKYKREKMYSKDEINKVYKKIAEYYLKNNEDGRAVDYYCKGECYKEAVLILEKLSYDSYINLNLKIVDKYIDIIPKEYVNKSPTLCGTKFLSSFIYKKGNLEEIYKSLINMRNIIPEDDPKRVALEVRILYANISLTKMKPNKFLKSFKECSNILKKNNHHLVALCVMLNIPSILRGVRDFSSWGVHYEFVESILKESIMEMFGDEGLWLLDIAIAELLYEKNDLSGALMRASKGVADSSTKGNISVYFVGMLVLMKILRTQGQSYEVKEMLTALEKKIKDEKAFQLEENLEALKARILLSSGDLEYSINWLNSLSSGIIISEFSISKIYIYMTAIRAYIYNSMYTQALIVLEALSVNLKDLNRVLDMIEVNILRAICFYEYNEESIALEYMDYAIKSAFKYKYIRMFANEGKLCALILSKYLKNKQDLSSEYKKYVRKLINEANKCAIMVPNKMTNNLSHVIEPLTKTEDEVLKLLLDGLKYSEISEKLNIKISTVKTHVFNIYSKLNVKNKNEAMLLMKSMKKN